MAAPPVIPPDMTRMPPMLEYKKDGTLSKMRAHKGNIPVLPQTKLCPHCPARFTRTTHLNRHLRTHSNEKLYHCDTCPAQFTRSDLLTRHKRSCNEVSNARGIKRKSCKPCAESKIKCDLQEPCTKCTSRGKECTYAPPSRSRAMAQRTRPIVPTKEEHGSPLALPSIEHSPLAFLPSVTSSQASATNSPESLASSPPSSQSPEVQAARIPVQGATVGISTSPYAIPVTSASGPPHHDTGYISSPYVSTGAYHHDPYEGSSAASFTASSAPPTSYATSVDYQASSTEYEDSPSPEITTASNLSALYASSGNLFPTFFSQVFAPQNTIEPASSSNAEEEETHISTASWEVNLPQVQHSPPQYHVPSSPSDSIPGPSLNFNNITVASPHDFAEIKLFCQPTGRIAANGDVRHNSPWPDDPPPEETQHYMYLFFSTFTRELPIVHPHTFVYEGKPDVLLRVLQACGALYVRTKKAARFIANTLTAVKQIFIHEFSKNLTDPVKQAHLVLAVCLIQTIGLFHERSDLRAASNLYHANKVAMLRRTGLFQVNGSWRPSTRAEVSVETLWRDWANYEVMKRSLLLSYMHDNINNIYFALPATYSFSEISVNLPSEDKLWDARTAEEWFSLLQKPSPYGSYVERQVGVSLHKAVHLIGQTHTLLNPYMLTPFGHFVVVHAFLAQLFCFCVEDRLPPDPASPPKPNIQQLTYRMQYSLFNWYKSWEASPDMPRPGPNEEPLFSQHALQYYWLGQIALLAHQEGLPPFEYGSPKNLEVDHRYQLVKVWLKHIRKFLCRPGAEPTKLWQEMMAIRLRAEGENPAIANGEDDGGILSFWPEH